MCNNLFLDWHDEAREVIRLGLAMREAQKTYFRTRDRADLIASKQAESAFDKAAAEALK